jgi:hypothetical protein
MGWPGQRVDARAIFKPFTRNCDNGAGISSTLELTDDVEFCPRFPSLISGVLPAAAVRRVRNLSNKLFGFKMIQLNKR